MTTIRYDTKYCPDAPYIYYHMLDDGYMVGGEYKTLEEAATARADIVREHGENKWEEKMGTPDHTPPAWWISKEQEEEAIRMIELYEDNEFCQASITRVIRNTNESRIRMLLSARNGSWTINIADECLDILAERGVGPKKRIKK